MRKYNILTGTSFYCRDRTETSDDALRRPKITSDHRSMAPSLQQRYLTPGIGAVPQ